MVGLLFNIFNIMGSEWVLWVLIILSVSSIAVMIERYKTLTSKEALGALVLKEQVDSAMAQGSLITLQAKREEIESRYPCMESALISALLSEKAPKDKKDLELFMLSLISRRKAELEVRLGFLGTLGSNAPFIGLFGTVLGIIKAFHELGGGGAAAAGMQGMSHGLSEALVATAVGLLVAIPAVLAFNTFQGKIKSIVCRTESIGHYIISHKE